MFKNYIFKQVDIVAACIEVVLFLNFPKSLFSNLSYLSLSLSLSLSNLVLENGDINLNPTDNQYCS